MAIKILDKQVINKISAGEVVEKPASIVKELVENSIDAGATAITIEIEKGGIDKIVVTDNGSGINRDEIILAFTPHATSKLTNFEDLNCLATKGFRGEALATISAVSKVTIITKTNDDEIGVKAQIVSGEEVERIDIATTTGTKIEVNNVFYNTPARLKFLKKPKSEEGDITNYVQKLILSHSNISFKYYVDGKLIYNTQSSGVIDNIYTIYGKEVAENVLCVDYKIGQYEISGYISKPEFSKANRTYQNLFVNSRFCTNSLISSAVSTAYENFAMKGKFPLYVLFISLPQDELDVNVHPNKLEVKFTDTSKIYKLCIDGVFKALSDYNHIRNVSDESTEINIERKDNVTFVNEVKEGVSFNKENREEILNRHTSEYFKNQNNTGSYGFELTDDILIKEVKQKEYLVPTEVSLSQTITENKKEDTTSKFVEQNSFVDLFELNYKIIGKVFNTYLILEQGDSVYFVDQHAAHERINYDNLVEQLEKNMPQKQNLLIPYVFNVSASEHMFLEENIDLINNAGIEINEFGKDSFKISAIPLILSNINLKQFVDNLLEDINGFVKSTKDVIKERIMQIACKASVKGGDDLKDSEIKALLNMLKSETKILLCPHGRPIVVELDKKQIEKWFKRIV